MRASHQCCGLQQPASGYTCPWRRDPHRYWHTCHSSTEHSSPEMERPGSSHRYRDQPTWTLRPPNTAQPSRKGSQAGVQHTGALAAVQVKPASQKGRASRGPARVRA